MNDIQKKLKETRKQKGFTQKKIADMLGITQQAYQQVETGRTEDMRVSTLIRICEILNVSSDWLLGIGESKKNAYDLAVLTVAEQKALGVKGMKIPGEKLAKRKAVRTKKATAKE